VAVEVKWDGIRAIAYCRPGRVELQTRNLNDVTARYPEVRRISRPLGMHEAVLDGELVAFDENGRPSFERLQQRIHNSDGNVVRRRMKSHPVVYVIFDLLYLDGEDLTCEPYSRRRELLEGLGLCGEGWQTPGHSVGHAVELLEASAAQGLEGVVLKRLDSVYVPGRRTGAWLKGNLHPDLLELAREVAVEARGTESAGSPAARARARAPASARSCATSPASAGKVGRKSFDAAQAWACRRDGRPSAALLGRP
jgi:ATP-dependent DNA ligase